MSGPVPPQGVHLTVGGRRVLELEPRYRGLTEAGNAEWSVSLPKVTGADIIAGRASVGIDVLPGHTSVVLEFDGP